MAAKTEPFRIVFMGTPAFAAEILERIAAWPLGSVVCVYTQPDRPGRRGRQPLASAVKVCAQRLGFEVRQPLNFKSSEEVDRLAALAPDFLLVAAYGLLLPLAVLRIPRFPPLNVHGSLLPAYRGAAPVQRAIMEGVGAHEESGVSIMQMVEALDAGPVFAVRRLEIGEKTADALLEDLAQEGGEALVEVLNALVQGTARSTPQNDALATYAPKLVKADGIVRWNQTAVSVHAQIRGVTSWPGAQTILIFEGQDPHAVQLLPGRIAEQTNGVSPGTVLVDREGLAVACADAWYRLLTLKPQGKAFMSAKAFVNGHLRDVPKGLSGRACDGLLSSGA